MDKTEYKGYTIELKHDTDAENPLDWATPEERGAWFVLHHKRYDLPCEVEIDLDQYGSWAEVAKAVTNGKPYKFVQWHEHGNIVVRLCDDEGDQGWDTGIAGVIFGNTTEDIEAAFANWKTYAEGDVYGYIITDADGEQVDSLWSLYGRDEALQGAKCFIDSYTPPHKVAKSARSLHQ